MSNAPSSRDTHSKILKAFHRVAKLVAAYSSYKVFIYIPNEHPLGLPELAVHCRVHCNFRLNEIYNETVYNVISETVTYGIASLLDELEVADNGLQSVKVNILNRFPLEFPTNATQTSYPNPLAIQSAFRFVTPN